MNERLETSLDHLSDYSDDALLAELRRVAAYLGTPGIGMRDVDEHGRCSYALLKQRFGGLTNALKAAGLDARDFRRDISDDELLDELERVWEEALARDGRPQEPVDRLKVAHSSISMAGGEAPPRNTGRTLNAW